MDVVQSIPHGVEVNRSRYSPQNPNLIATRQGSGHCEVFIFDRTKHPSKPIDNLIKPDLTLKGHQQEGYGLSWNKSAEGELATCGNDQLVCLWNINTGTKENRTLEPIQIYRGHTSIVEDCEFHPTHKHLLVSVGDDKLIAVWDSRQENQPAQSIQNAHQTEINSLSFNPYSEFVFATAGSDRLVKLWDLRHVKHSIHTLNGHQDEIFSLQWSPFSTDVLASSGCDKRVFVWDLSRIGLDQTAEEAKDGPPELLFIHGGHTDRISDFSWNPNAEEEWTIASVADDNVIQCWRMAENIYTQERELTEAGKDNQTEKNNS